MAVGLQGRSPCRLVILESETEATDMEIRFPGGKKVEAVHKGFHIVTDQPVAAGGENAAPSPFDLFLASIGTCSGFYVLSFCEKRGIPMEGISLSLDVSRDERTHMVSEIAVSISLPASFPAEYVDACVRSAELCAVKKHLQTAPAVRVAAGRAG
jgi:putative redox protein